MNILLTGGTGYIGSHTAVVLAGAGHQVVLYDNLANSDASVVDRLEKIAGARLPFVLGDIRHTALLVSTLKSYGIEAVIHFAGLKAVGESVQNPLEYYDNNVGGTISLLNAMTEVGIKRLVFSSSATVYGDPQYLPIDEAHPRSATNPYGRTKLQIENILEDLAASDSSWHITCLRYFNPVGAHPSGLIGEMPLQKPDNLVPVITQTAVGKRDSMTVFGGKLPTRDGSCIRDYVHVMDIASAHVMALKYLQKNTEILEIINLGTGLGVSVFEAIRIFEEISGRKLNFSVGAPREGDVIEIYSDARKARDVLGWQAKHSVREMMESAWKWEQILSK